VNAGENILLHWQATYIEDTRLAARNDKIPLPFFRDDSCHDGGMGGIVAQQPETQRWPEALWKVIRCLPQSGESEQVPAGVEMVQMAYAFVVTRPVQIAPRNGF
jgi:hypothetical protein